MATKNPRFVLTLSPYLKHELAALAKRRGCSEAEVLKTGLIRLIEAEERQ